MGSASRGIWTPRTSTGIIGIPRSYVRERDPEQLQSAMGAGAADIAEVVSDVWERLPNLEKPPTLEPEQARFRLFENGFPAAAIDFGAGRFTLGGPAIPASAGVRGGRLLVIGTYRDVEVTRRHPLSQTLGELTRERLFWSAK